MYLFVLELLLPGILRRKICYFALIFRYGGVFVGWNISFNFVVNFFENEKDSDFCLSGVVPVVRVCAEGKRV